VNLLLIYAECYWISKAGICEDLIKSIILFYIELVKLFWHFAKDQLFKLMVRKKIKLFLICIYAKSFWYFTRYINIWIIYKKIYGKRDITIIEKYVKKDYCTIDNIN